MSTEKKAIAVSGGGRLCAVSSALNTSLDNISGCIAIGLDHGDLILTLAAQRLGFVDTVVSAADCAGYDGITAIGAGRCNNPDHLAVNVSGAGDNVIIEARATLLTLIESITVSASGGSHCCNVLTLAAECGDKVTAVPGLAERAFYACIPLLLTGGRINCKAVGGNVPHGFGVIVSVGVSTFSARVLCISLIIAGGCYNG